METVVTIPDEVFRKVEDLATALGMSRSELYTAALAEFIRERRDLSITEHLDQVYAQDDSELDPFIRQLQSASLPVEQW
jgi:metal-responsive CopG/Arc/MetJ family transcriptional regulator